MGLITQSHVSFDDFGQAFHGKSDGYGYARYFYTDEREVEEELARYAGSQDAALFNSGMAGIVTLMETLIWLAKLKVNLEDQVNIWVSDTLYSQSTEYFDSLIIPRWSNVKICKSSVNKFKPESWDDFERRSWEAMEIVFLETIGNGYEMPVADADQFLRRFKSSRHRFLVIDNTFLTTSLFDIFALARKYGVLNKVIVVESATKYYQRGGDAVTAGVVFGPEKILKAVKERRAMMGTYLQPMCIDQLPICPDILHREVMPRHSRNAYEFARFLERQPRVCEVKYPLLPSHPQYELARRMFPNGAGGLFFFKLRGGKLAAKKFVDSLGYCHIGGSFGHATTWVAPLDAVKDGDTGIIRVAAGFKRGDRKETIEDFKRALGKL